MKKKICIPDVVAMFAAYYEKNPAWGSLHVVLDDGNTDNVENCREWAVDRGDAEGVVLADLLEKMTRTQRRKLPSKVHEYLDKKRTSEDKKNRVTPDGILILPLSMKLAGLKALMEDGAYEDAAGHLCDLLEFCRTKIVTGDGMMFANLEGMINKYGKNPTPVSEK